MKITLLIFAFLSTSYLTCAQSLNPTSNIRNATLADTFNGGYTFSYATAGTPWNGSLLSYGGFNNQYDCQINSDYGPHGGNHISFRTKNGDANIWNSWNEIYHTGNINSLKYALGQGNLGIGTTTPNQKLSVAGNIATSIGSNEGGSLILENPLKNSNGLAYQWTLYNMTGSYGNSLQFWSYSQDNSTSGPKMIITDNGNVLINKIAQTNTSYRLDVNGKVRANEIVVNTNGADYVFENTYKLRPLKEIEIFVKENRHLPEIPTAKTMREEGVRVGELQTKLLQKVEELTLYIIQQQKEIEELKKKINN